MSTERSVQLRILYSLRAGPLTLAQLRARLGLTDRQVRFATKGLVEISLVKVGVATPEKEYEITALGRSAEAAGEAVRKVAER